MKAFFLALALLFVSRLAVASPVLGLLSIGGDFGGDELIKVRYTDGTEASLFAGTGFKVDGGIIWRVLDHGGIGLDLQGTLGWKYMDVSAQNQDLSLSRFPAELLAFYHLKMLRLGAGLQYQFAPTFNASGNLVNGNSVFDPALGEVLQADLTFAKRFQLALRYTLESYHKGSSPTINANSVGFGLGVLLGHGV
jgi:hypothetical protein